jgi:hypothetical protein
VTDTPTGRPANCACDGLTDLCCHACWQAGFETAADNAVADEYGVRAACACAASDLGVRTPLGDAELGREVGP